MKLKPYPKYRDSGVPWLGEVPDHWEVKPGLSIFKEKQVKNKGLIEKQVLTLSYGKIKIKPEEKLRGLVPESFDTYQIVEPGDIIIRSTDMQNDHTSLRTGLVKDKGIITSAYICLNSLNNELSNFNHWLLHGLDLMKVFYGLGSGLRQNLSWSDFKRLPLPVPPKQEQQQIARYLDWKTAQINKFIRNKRRLIQLLKEQKQNIINQAVTKGINPNVEMKDSGVEWLGEIPAHWVIRRLKYISKLNKETLTDSTDPDYWFYYVDIGCVSTGTISKNLELLNYSNAPSRARRIVSKGDTIISTVRTYLKAIYHFEDDISNIIVSTGFAVLTPVGIFPKMLGYLLLFDGFINQVIKLSVGASYPAINTEHLCSIPVAFPEDQQEQQSIVSYIEKETSLIDKTISRTEREIELIQEYRSRLISDVVTGKLDVRGIEIPDFEPVEADLELEEDEESEDEEIDEDE